MLIMTPVIVYVPPPHPHPHGVPDLFVETNSVQQGIGISILPLADTLFMLIAELTIIFHVMKDPKD
jgi:hypothetical protein